MAKKTDPFSITFTGDELIVVIAGKEPFLQTQLHLQLRGAIETHAQGEIESIRHDGANTQLADVLDDLRSYGLMQQHRFITVIDADNFVKTHRAALERYAAAPVDTATLVLRTDTWNKGKLDKLIEKIGAIHKCDKPTPAATMKWLTARAKSQYGSAIEPQAATLLLDQIGVDLGRLDTELGKLAVQSGKSNITAEQVQALVGQASDEMAFAIQQAIMTGRAAVMIEKLHELVDLSRQSEVPINWAVIDLMRKLHHAAAMLDKRMPDKAICSQLRIWPFDAQRPFINAARKLGRANAARMLHIAIEVDRRSKSGLGEPMRNLERFCVQYASALAG